MKKYILFLIILLASFLRLYKLGSVPPSLYWDEASLGYNAYSILTTGHDEHGRFLPLTNFAAFGDYKPPGYIYATVPSIAVFGLNEFAIRFPSALFGILTVLLSYFLAKKLFENAVVALLTSFFLAISPWHLQFSRYDHEANFMTFFSILGLVLFLYSFKKYPLFVASSVSFGIALNTYHGAKIWVPLFLLCIFYWYKKEILSFGSKLLFPVLILAIFTLPIIGNFPQSLIRGESVGIFQNEKPLKTFISGYLSHYSPNFLFISGDPIGRHSVVGMGQLYIFELPLILLGLIALIQARTRDTKFFLAWLLLAPIPSAMATPTPHALRSITFLPVWSIIAAYGAGSFAAFRIGNRLKLSIALIVALLGLYNFATYLHLYYKHEPKLKSPDWSDGYKEMVSYVVKVAKNYEIITISNYYGRPYVFVLFYSEYDPRLYQPQSADKEKFDKYEFFGTSWEKKTPGKVLVVRPKWQIPNPAPKYLKFIHGTSGDLIFRISEE